MNFKHPIFLSALGLTLIWLGLHIAGYNGLYGQDAHAYFQFSREIKAFLLGGEAPGAFDWPVLYSFFGALFGMIFELSLALSLISLLSFLGTLYFTQKIISELFDVERLSLSIFLSIFMAFSPYFFRAGMVNMSDMMGTFFLTGAVHFMLRYWKSSANKDLIRLVTFAGISILTRYPNLLILLPGLIFTGYHFFKNFRWKPLGSAIIIFVLLLLPQLILGLKSGGPFAEKYLQAFDVVNLFRSSFETEYGFSAFTVPNCLYIFSPFLHIGYFVLGIPLLFFLKKEDFTHRPILLLLGGVSAYLVLIGLLPTQNQRYFVPVFPIVLSVFYPAFRRLWEKLAEWKGWRALAFGILLLVQIGLCGYAMRVMVRISLLEQEIADSVAKSEQFRPVYAFYVTQSLRSYVGNREIIELYDKEYTGFQSKALVVFAPESLRSQWENTNPMLNWERLNATHELIEVKSFDMGWKLYEIR